MSASKFICNGITLKGKRCNRIVSEKMYCFQHLHQSIHHSSPVIGNVDINLIKTTIEDNSKPVTHCSKRNKYGEYTCKEQCVTGYKCCEKHNLEYSKLMSTLKNITNINVMNLSYYQVSLDSKLKTYYHLVNYIKKHSEKILYFNDEVIVTLINSIKKTQKTLSNNFYVSNHFLIPIKLRRQNKSYQYYKSKLELYISELENHIPSIQIKRNIDTFISNSVKLQKVSECHVKVGNVILPVICKGINEKILSFIV